MECCGAMCSPVPSLSANTRRSASWEPCRWNGCITPEADGRGTCTIRPSPPFRLYGSGGSFKSPSCIRISTTVNVTSIVSGWVVCPLCAISAQIALDRCPFCSGAATDSASMPGARGCLHPRGSRATSPLMHSACGNRSTAPSLPIVLYSTDMFFFNACGFSI